MFKIPEGHGEIAIDLDGTLAYYDTFKGEDHVGHPIPGMVDFVLDLINSGEKVVIFTARAYSVTGKATVLKWLQENGIPPLEVTNTKKKEFKVIIDDRAIQVDRNSGSPTVSNTALSRQVGGNWYKEMAIQPAEYCHKNKLGSLESSVIKYVSRHKKKNGEEDIKKAIHLLEMLLEWDYGE